MKWLIGIVTVAVSLGTPGCTTPQPAEGATQFVFAEAPKQALSGETSTNISQAVLGPGVTLASIVKQNKRVEKYRNNAATLQRIVKKVKKYSGKTWYVFAGSTPRGWDCSGLVRWTYQQAGITLYHSASAQMNSGKKVKTPKVGDLVAFSYGGRYAGHIGVYVGNGNFIHAPRPGVRTIIENVNNFARNIGSRVVYTRILDTGNFPVLPPLARKHVGFTAPHGAVI